MILKVERKWKKQNYTIGILYINGIKFCNTLEDKVRDLSREAKVYGKTAIPAGTYRVENTYSPKYKRKMPQVMNVPFFEGIRIHSGNTEEDTEGCILVGINNVVGKVTDSRNTYNRLYDRMCTAWSKGESITIEISD